MKKIIIFGFIALSIVNLINAMEKNIHVKLPKEMWVTILKQSMLIENIIYADTLPELKNAMNELFNFIKTNKSCYIIVFEQLKKINLNDEEINLKKLYVKRKNEIIQAVKEKLKYQFNKMFAFTCFDSSFGWFTGINSQDPEHDWTPLILAIFCKSKELVELMIKNGADLNIEGKDKITVLRHAIIRDDKIFELLLSNGATSKRLYS